VGKRASAVGAEETSIGSVFVFHGFVGEPPSAAVGWKVRSIAFVEAGVLSLADVGPAFGRGW
jgi:hypothetical protein